MNIKGQVRLPPQPHSLGNRGGSDRGWKAAQSCQLHSYRWLYPGKTADWRHVPGPSGHPQDVRVREQLGLGAGRGSCQPCFQRPPDWGSFSSCKQVDLPAGQEQNCCLTSLRHCNVKGGEPVTCPTQLKNYFSFLKLRYTTCLFSKAPWGNESTGQIAEEGRCCKHFTY